METLSLSKQAERILSDNDKGGYTIPSQLLYPFQWNWDSAFCALGWQQISLERASREVECLLKGQWKNGMIPHILFHRDASSYFPGPDYWCAGESVPSSGYSQPPVLAMAVRAMLRKHRSPAFAERVREWFPRLVAYHRWFWRERNPEGKGLVCVLHPWESGRDNLPDWDLGLEEVDTGAVKDFRRSDTDIVDSSLRPLNRDYQRYLALVEIGKQRGWDSEKMIRDQPFVMYDVLMTAVLIRANRELLEIGEMIGETGSAGEITGWIETAATNFGDLWNEEKQAFCSYDLKKKAFAGHASSATVAALLTETVKGERLKTTLETFDR